MGGSRGHEDFISGLRQLYRKSCLLGDEAFWRYAAKLNAASRGQTAGEAVQKHRGYAVGRNGKKYHRSQS